MVRLMEGEQECNNRTQTYPDYDGEIKAPGPFRSMSLVVLSNFRDLVLSGGPGFQSFLSSDKGLSGTS